MSSFEASHQLLRCLTVKIFILVIPCPDPPEIKNMEVKYGNLSSIGYFFGNMVMYQCAEGYRLISGNPGNIAIRCTALGRWTKMLARCESKLNLI